MAEETGIQHIEGKPTTITKNDIQILDDLMHRTDALPDILHLRAAEPGYIKTEDDKKLLLATYSELDDILKEVAAFINIKFPGCERHVRAWNEIDFDTKIGSLKIITTDREHVRREWRKGLFDLKSLIKVLRNESVLLVEESKNTTAIQNTHQHVATHTNEVIPVNRRQKIKSLLEILSWIAGILGTAISLYLLFK